MRRSRLPPVDYAAIESPDGSFNLSSPPSSPPRQEAKNKRGRGKKATPATAPEPLNLVPFEWNEETRAQMANALQKAFINRQLSQDYLQQMWDASFSQRPELPKGFPRLHVFSYLDNDRFWRVLDEAKMYYQFSKLMQLNPVHFRDTLRHVNTKKPYPIEAELMGMLYLLIYVIISTQF